MSCKRKAFLEKWERMKYEGFGRIILGIITTWIPKSRLQSTLHVHGVQRGNCFGGELIRKTEIEVRVRKLKNGKAASKHEVTGEMIKGGRAA